MAESNAVVGLGAQVKIGDGASPETFTLIAECKDIEGPQVEQEFADFTHQQSTGGFRERKATWKTSGDVTFNCGYYPSDTGQTALIAAAIAVPTTLTNFQIITNSSKTIAFSAYPTIRYRFPMSASEEMAVTLHLEGSFTVT